MSVRVTKETAGDAAEGYVITLDDITDLVSAQRSAAWADVARRIAHEIKNPLTPIQLSAERLKRKYGKFITSDREVFDQCTNTIIRQVDDIKRMVDEFSSFARTPKPVLEESEITDVAKHVLFLMQVARPDIDFVAELPSAAQGALRPSLDRAGVDEHRQERDGGDGTETAVEALLALYRSPTPP